MSCDDTLIISKHQILGPPLVGTGTVAIGVVSTIRSVSLFVPMICIVYTLLTFLKHSLKDNDGVVPFSQEPKRVPKVSLFFVVHFLVHLDLIILKLHLPRSCMSMSLAEVAVLIHTLKSPHSCAVRTLIAMMESVVPQTAVTF